MAADRIDLPATHKLAAKVLAEENGYDVHKALVEMRSSEDEPLESILKRR